MNQRGSAMAVVFIPILIISLVVVMAVNTLVSTYQEKQTICRKTAIGVQEIQSTALTNLLRLNTQAKILRYSEIALDIAIATAVVTPGAQVYLPQLYRQRKHVRRQRLRLDKAQKTIINASNVQANIKAQTFRKYFPLAISNPGTIKLQVIPVQKNIIAPEYKTRENFEKVQSMGFQYKIQIRDIIPKWAFNFIKEPSNLKLTCRATIKNKEGKWTPNLSEDRSYLSWL